VDPWPLAVIAIPLVMVVSALAIYRSIYPVDKIKEALETIAEYRVLKSQARAKKDIKKLRALEPRYRRARSLITRALLVKMFLLLSGYIAGSIILFVTVPVIEAPFHLPPLTIPAEGSYYMLSVTAYFLVYVVLFLVFRDSFL